MKTNNNMTINEKALKMLKLKKLQELHENSKLKAQKTNQEKLFDSMGIRLKVEGKTSQKD